MKNTTAALLLLGLVIASVFIWGSRTPSQTDAANQGVVHLDCEAVVEQLVLLRESQLRHTQILEQIARALNRAPSQAAPGLSARTPGEPFPGDTLAELVGSLDALRVSLEAQAVQTRALIQTEARQTPKSLMEIRKRVASTNWRALAGLEDQWRSDATAADRSQQFLTPQDLLETYGPPTEIYRPKGGLMFFYRQHAEGMTGPASYFRIQEGIVVEYWIEDEVAGKSED